MTDKARGSDPLNLHAIEAHLNAVAAPANQLPRYTHDRVRDDVRALLAALREARTALKSIATACEMCGAFGYPTYSDLEARARAVLGSVVDA